MIEEYTAQAVAMDVLEHLERRRPAIVDDARQIDAEIDKALEPVRRSYRDSELPPVYLAALEQELKSALPVRWKNVAAPFTAEERRGFGLWRGGDVVARLTYVFGGLVLGGLIVAAPFIPIWEKWFPFALSIAAWWLPDLQLRGRRKRYALALGEIVKQLAGAQKALDRHITVQDLLPPGEST